MIVTFCLCLNQRKQRRCSVQHKENGRVRRSDKQRRKQKPDMSAVVEVILRNNCQHCITATSGFPRHRKKPDVSAVAEVNRKSETLISRLARPQEMSLFACCAALVRHDGILCGDLLPATLCQS